jgi:hypothetical protein
MKSVCNLKFTSYELSISPDNKKVVFNFVSEKSGKIYGAVVLVKSSYVRTTFNENLGLVDIMLNSKSACIQNIK